MDQEFKSKISAELDLTKVEDQLKDLSKKNITLNVETGSSTNNVNNVNKTIKKAEKSAISFGTSAAVAAKGIKLISNAASDATEAVKTFDNSIKDLRMATNGTYEETANLVKGYNQMGIAMGATTSEVNNAADAWLRQGHSVSDTNKLIASSMILSKVAQMDSADATTALTSAYKGYGLEVEDVANIVSKITSVDLVSATSAKGLADAMAKTAVTAKDAGISMDKLLGYLAAIGEVVGEDKMSSVGNAMKTVISRMNQIKSGKLELVDEDGTVELLSDVEIALKNAGINLRKTLTEYNNYGDVLDELSQKWNTFNQVQQNAIVQALGGTRQQEIVRVLLANYDNATKYMQTAEQSAGTAEQKFEAYLDSLEAKTKSCQAAFESLAFNAIDGQLVGSIIDASTSILTMLDNTNALKTGLTGLVTATVLKGITSLATGISGAAIRFNQFKSALDMVKGGNIGADKLQQLVIATQNLSASQTKCIITSRNLTNEQRMSILTNQGISQAEAQAMLATYGLSTAQGAATASTFTLSGAIKGLGRSIHAAFLSNPIGASILAISTAVGIATTVISNYETSYQRAVKKVEESASAYESAKSQVESLNSELETTKSRIDELNAKDSLTFIEQEELDKLKDATAELKAQLLLMEEEEQKKKVQYLEDQTKLYNEKYKDQFDPTSPAIGQVLSLLKDYNIKDFIEAINLLNEINGTADESGYVYDFTDDISNSIADKKSEYEEYKTYLIEFLGDLYEELGDEAFGTELYQTIKQDLIQSAQLFGDNVTLSNYMFTDDQMQDVKDQIINYFTNGGTIEGVSEAIGDSLYQSFSDACNKLGIPISEMLNNMYAEATDNLDPVWLQNKMLQSFQDIAIANDVEEEYVSTQKELQEYTRDFTNTQKQLWIEATEGATSATEAVNLYKQALYGNDRNSYISDHLTNLLVPTKQDGEFYNFINSLDDEDYQIVLKLDVDASTPIKQIQEQIRNSKEEFSDIFSAIFSGTGDDAVTFEDALGNTKDTIDEIKGYLDDLYENGIKGLSSEAISSIEKLSPGFSSALSSAEDKTGAAIEYLTQLLEKQDDEIIKFLDNLLALENLSDSTVAYIENLKATLQDETTYTRDLGGLLAEYQTGAKLDDLFYAFQDGNAKSYRDAIDDTSSRISSLTEAYDKLWEYQLKVGEASNDIDSAEFTKFITDLIREFPELAQYTDGTINSIEGLREAIARLCETEPNEIVSALQELSDSADLTEEMRNQIDLLIDSLSNLSTIDMSMDTTKNVISDIREEAQNLAELISTINGEGGLHLNIEDAQKYLDIYPELLAGAQMYADGTVLLNQDTVNSFIKAKEAEIQADAEARIQELENKKAVLVAERDYALQKMEIISSALASGNYAEMQAAINSIETMDKEKQAKIQSESDKLKASGESTEKQAENSDKLNDKIAQDSVDESTNLDRAATQASDSFALNFGNMTETINGTIQAGNLLSQQVANIKAGNGATVSLATVVRKGGSSLGGISAQKTTSLDSYAFTQSLDSGNLFSSNTYDLSQQRINDIKSKANELASKLYLQWNSAVEEYNSANAGIAEYQKQIDMIKANGGLNIPEYVSGLVRDLANKNADKSSGSKGSGSKGSDKGAGSGTANEFKENIDWIETAVKRIEYGIQSLEKIAGNAYSVFSDRNTALVQELEQVRNEIDLQTQAYAYYMTQAESVNLSDYWKNKVQRGEVNVEELTDENLVDQIKAYEEYYEKALNAHSDLMDLNEKISDLFKESFDLISSTSNSILSDFENRANLIEGAISQTEERGYLVGKSFYEELTKFENQNIDTLNKKRTDLLNKFSEAVNSGAIREGSEEWYNMKSQIDEVTQSIQEATTKTIEYANAVRDIDWERFNLIQDKISNIVTESNFLIELMSNSDLFDDKGKITNEGISTMGLHGVNYNTYMEQADQYRDEMLRINEDLANDPNNQTLIDRKEELLELQQESITAAEEEKQAIKDLVEQGIEKELDALKKLIQEYEDALDSQKDLYEYQKNIEDQTTEISKLQKQIASLSNDDSEENRAKLQELNESLKEAKENLEETQYDQFISDQKKLLDELYTEYERILNERLDNLDLLIQQCVDAVNMSSDTISTTLTEVSDKVGYDITNKIDEVFSPSGEFGNSITSAISTYNDNFSSTMNGISSAMTGIQSVIQGISVQIEEMAKAADKESQAKVEEIKTQTEESAVKKEPAPSSGTTNNNNSSNTGSSNNSSGDGVPRVGDIVTYTGSYMYSSYGKRPAGNLYSGVQDAVEIYQINSGNGVVNPYRIKYVRGGDLGWVSLSQLKGYKTGVKDLDYDQLAIINEEGNETIVRPDGSILTPLTRGTSVLNNTATENLWNMTNNPSDFIEKYTEKFQPKIPSSLMNNSNSNITNEISMSITLPNVTNYKEFATGLQHDPNFEKMIGCMIDARTMGTSRYKKYTVNFGK